MVYFVLAMCLFSGQAYEEVARLLTEGLRGRRRWRSEWKVPSTAAISKARSRLGAEPMRELFAAVCAPVATESTPGAFYRRWRLAAIDGTTFDVPDTKDNVKAFGRPRSGRGEATVGYPQIRLVSLVECGTHVIFAATTGPLRTSEHALARQVVDSLQPGMLALADRGFFGVDLWKQASVTGADLLWRVRKDIVLPLIEQLPDGSYLSAIFDQRDMHHTRAGLRVRAVEYTLPDSDEVYRLITTILDPDQAPAAELAAMYAQRWEFESTLDEIKTHLGGPKLVLRSQYPDGAEQELYGFLLVHHAIRHLMHQAAARVDQDPDRISFTRSLRVVRRQVTDQAAFSPRQTRPRRTALTGRTG